VLLVIARPLGEADVGYHAVARPLLEKRAAVAGEVAIDLLRPPTFAALQLRLREAKTAGKPYHILHFDGHGTFTEGGAATVAEVPAEAQGFLLFEGEQGGEARVSAAELGALLDETDVPLVVLNGTCQR
jgi:hypothetical protein